MLSLKQEPTNSLFMDMIPDDQVNLRAGDHLVALPDGIRSQGTEAGVKWGYLRGGREQGFGAELSRISRTLNVRRTNRLRQPINDGAKTWDVREKMSLKVIVKHHGKRVESSVC
jgi:hypothetical protein